MPTLALPPQDVGFSLSSRPAVNSVVTSGGMPRTRRDLLRPYFVAQLHWICTSTQYDYLVQFHAANAARDYEQFSCSIPGPKFRGTTQTLQFIPNTFRLARQSGNLYEVTAQVQIYRAAPTLLNVLPKLQMRFEDAVVDDITASAFTLAGNTAYVTGVFGKGLQVNGNLSASSKANTTTPLASWDLQSATYDWVICGWAKLTAPMTSPKHIIQITGGGIPSTQDIIVSAQTYLSNTMMRFIGYHPYASAFLTTVQVAIPYDNNPHFFALGRYGNTLQMSVDGSARSGANGGTAGGTPWTTAATYRSTPGARNIYIGNNTVNTQAFIGMIDCLQIYRGQVFDFVNGFAVPTTEMVWTS